MAGPENSLKFPIELGPEASDRCNQIKQNQFNSCFSCLLSPVLIYRLYSHFPFLFLIYFFHPYLFCFSLCSIHLSPTSLFPLFLCVFSVPTFGEPGILYNLRISQTLGYLSKVNLGWFPLMLIFNLTNT